MSFALKSRDRNIVYFWLCVLPVRRGCFLQLSGEVKKRWSNGWNCGLFWCHEFHKRVILDNRAQMHCIAKQWFLHSAVSSGNTLVTAKMWFFTNTNTPSKVLRCSSQVLRYFSTPPYGNHSMSGPSVQNQGHVQYTPCAPVYVMKITFWFAYALSISNVIMPWFPFSLVNWNISSFPNRNAFVTPSGIKHSDLFRVSFFFGFINIKIEHSSCFWSTEVEHSMFHWVNWLCCALSGVIYNLS